MVIVSGKNLINSCTIKPNSDFPVVYIFNIFFNYFKIFKINYKQFKCIRKNFSCNWVQEHWKHTSYHLNSPRQTDACRRFGGSRGLVPGSNNVGTILGTISPLFLKIFLYKNFTPISNQIYFNFKFRIAVVWSCGLWADLRGRKSHWFAFFNHLRSPACAVCWAWGGWAQCPQTKLGVRYTLASCAIWGVSPYRY